jgi:hypothetical protein
MIPLLVQPISNEESTNILPVPWIRFRRCRFHGIDRLDEAEGVGSGYEHAMVTVINDKGRRRKVLTYLATPDYIDDSLKPYGWYKDFVLAGGREHDLPPEYIAEYIQSVEAIEDPNKTRDKKQRATLESPGR